MNKIRSYINRRSVTNPDSKRLWRQIESRILIDGLYGEANRLSLEKAISGLIDPEPDRNIWTDINSQIKIQRRTTATNTFILAQSPVIRIAATIILIVCSVVLLQLYFPQQSEKKINALKKQPIESFLTYICSKYPKKCSEPDFLELKSEIIQLDNEKSEIENSIFFNPDDMATVRVNDRINNQIINLRDQIIEYVE